MSLGHIHRGAPTRALPWPALPAWGGDRLVQGAGAAVRGVLLPSCGAWVPEPRCCGVAGAFSARVTADRPEGAQADQGREESSQEEL